MGWIHEALLIQDNYLKCCGYCKSNRGLAQSVMTFSFFLIILGAVTSMTTVLMRLELERLVGLLVYIKYIHKSTGCTPVRIVVSSQAWIVQSMIYRNFYRFCLTSKGRLKVFLRE